MLLNMVALPMWLEKDITGYPKLMLILSTIAIPLLLLEYYDRRGILRREGDVRRAGAHFGEL